MKATVTTHAGSLTGELEPHLSAHGRHRWVQAVQVTPELANNLLERNVKNRSMTVNHVESISHDITEGRWRFNGGTIVFNADGSLSDGQHRLMAIALSGETVECLVVVLDPADTGAQRTTDGGRKRSLADQLGLAGVENYTTVATTLRSVVQIERWMSGNFDSFNYSVSQGFTDLDCRPLIREVSGPATNIANKRPAAIAAGVVASLWVLFAEVSNPEEAEWFWRKFHAYNIGKDAPTSPTDPIWQLREAVSRKRDSMTTGSSLSPKWATAMAIKSWNLHRDSAEVRQLKWTSSGPTAELFPVPR